ncbi:MAG: hypothetical protein HY287_04915 [Planctomycetes bacterium]|nr:hypothetical protein [Planctomycetota bacterium]MBI3833655.1 hypothetical protein [Planctomycetota bacterium]
MKIWIRNIGISLGCVAALCGIFGCATHDHKSTSTYEYNDERAGDHRDPPPTAAERQKADSEWHMASPGQMVVDPSKK